MGFVEREQSDFGMHMRARLPKEFLEFIDSGIRTDWIPLSLDAVFVTEMVATLGPALARDVSRKYMRENLVKSPGLRAIVEGCVRIFGISVCSLLNAVPGSFRQSHRDFGTIEVKRTGDRESMVVIRDIPPEVMRVDAYPLLFEGVFLGIYDVAGIEPKLDSKVDREDRRIEARFRW